eukprot:CFRG4928T1
MSEEELQSLLGIELQDYDTLRYATDESCYSNGLNNPLLPRIGGECAERSLLYRQTRGRRTNSFTALLSTYLNQVRRTFPFRYSPSTAALLLSAVASVVGIGLSIQFENKFLSALRCSGLFALCAGLINWLSVRLLYTNNPCLAYCGTVASNGSDVKERLKAAVFDHIFDRHFVAAYIQDALHSSLEDLNLDARFEWIINSPSVQKVLEKKLSLLLGSSHGIYLQIAGFSLREFKPAIKPYLISFSSELTPVIMARAYTIGESEINLLKDILDGILESEMIDMNDEDVVELVEMITSQPFNWLVACSSTFGALLGLFIHIAKSSTLL